MRQDGERILIQSVRDGEVLAEAAIAGGSRDGGYYRDLRTDQLPLFASEALSAATRKGLAVIAHSELPVASISAQLAASYLTDLGVRSW